MLKSNARKFLVAIAFIFIATSLFAQKDLVISGGNTVSSFVCENKTAFVWGSNNSGQLGLHVPYATNPAEPLITTDPITSPTAITKFNGVASPPDIKQINSGSGSHFVALACAGDVWAWGVNGSGQIGIGSSGGVVTIPTRVIANTAVAAANRGTGNVLQNAAVVYSGTVNSFAILQDGKLVSWGGNSGDQAGQLGNGNTTDQSTANYVLTASGTPLAGVVQVFAGDNVAYALVDPDGDGVGTVYSWGNGLNGTLGRNANGTGNPTTSSANDLATVQDSYARPVYYSNQTQMNNIVQLQAGDVFGIALDGNGYVWSWGNNYWNNSTGTGTNNGTGNAAVANTLLSSSGPQKVLKGLTTGASNDGTYLLAKAIGGGQGYGMAVSIDGKPVAWGGTGACANGGMTGTGANNGTASLVPQYIQYGAGLVHSNVTLINRGDTWGFYGTSDNDFYAWGCNDFGQLGIGSTTNQAYATKITPPSGCSFRDPLPTAHLNHPDTTVCQSKFTSLALTSGFTPPTTNGGSYTLTWTKTTLPLPGTTTIVQGPGLATTASNLKYTATAVGKYNVIIHYTGSNSGCVTYADGKDSITIAAFPQNFTVPTTLTYCGTAINPYVTGLGNYSWYKDPTGGTALTTTQKSNKATIATSAVNAPSAGVITVYVQETGQYVGNIAKITPTTCTSITNKDNYNPVNSVFTLTNTTSLTIDTITVYVANNNATYSNIQLAIYNTKLDGSAAHKVANTGSVLYTTAAVSVTTVGTTGYTALKIPVNYTINGTPGNSYAIGFVKNSINGLNVANFDCNKVGTTDDIATGGPYLTSTGSESNGNWVNGFGSLGNVLFHTPMGFCDRVAVKLTQSCPCTPPTSVTITPATQSLCVGAAFKAVGVVTLSATPPTGAYQYTWYKGTYSVANIVAGPSATYSDFNIAAVATTDAGTYTLRVEDYTAPGGVASCYKEASVVVTVNPKPTITSAATGTVCSGVAQSYAITSSVASSYSWTRAAVTNITPATGSGTTSPITETLTLAAGITTATTVTYVITPTSTTGSCLGTPFNYVVTVNPTPVITSAATGTICSGIAQAYAITSNVPSGYAWSRAAVANVTPAAAGTGTTTPITETLTLGAAVTTPTTVTYVLTPTSTTGSCAGAPSNYVVTVNPTPKINSAATGTICSGIAQNYAITSNVPSGYAWSRAAVTGITPATGSGTTSPITETLTNAGSTVLTVTYVITPTSTTGTCAGTPFNYVVTVNPVPTISSAATGTICSGVAQSYAITSVVPSSYSWTRAVVTNITPGTAGSGTTTPITETLTLGAGITTPTNVTYIITPTSTTGSCLGTPFNYVVTVNPKPVITSSPTGTVCSGVAQNYAITSNVVSTYSWTRAAVAGVNAGATGSGTTSPITEALTLGAAVTTPTTVTYVITPTAGCAGTAFNYVVTVNPSPVITSSGTGTICTGIAQNYTITSNIASSYSWTRASVAGITPATGSGTTSPITETLTNGGTTALTATYVITPTATTGTCAGTPFNYVVTVNPKPAITSSSTGNVCSGVAQNYAITSNVASTYSWSRAAVTNVAPAVPGAGTGTPITETLTLAAGVTSPTAVTYVITPTSTAGTCAGTAFNYVVTVNPKPTITSSSSGTTCTAVALNYLITSDVASVYSWTRSSVAGITPTTGSGTSNPITEILTGSGTVVYVITPTSTAGTCAGTPFNYTVVVSGTAVPTVTLTTNPGTTICAGTPVTFTATPTSGGNAVYAWSSSVNGPLAPTTDTYSSSSLVNNEVITVVLTSDLGCANPKTATASKTMTVNANVVPAVSVTANPSTAICPGANVTFTAAPTNGGTATYQWYKGTGTVPGTLITAETNATYSTTGAANGDNYYVVMTSTATCASPATATSIPVSVTVTPVPTIGVSITQDFMSICANNTVTFTATATGSGADAGTTYEWFIGPSTITTAAGGTTQEGPSTTATSFATSALTAANNKVYVQVVSHAACALSTTVGLSNVLSTTVNTGISPGSIGTDQQICSNGTVSGISQTAASDAVTASYVWQESGTPSDPASWITASGTPTGGGTGFTPAGAKTADVYYRRVVTDASAPAPCNTATSNVIHITVLALPNITSAPTGTICSGASQNYVITSDIASGYSWSRAAVSGVNGNAAGSGTSSPITESLTLAAGSTSPVNVVYSIVPKSITGSCTGPAFTYTVTVNPTPHITSPASDVICSGVAQGYPITSDIVSGYSWSRASVAGITNPGVTGQTSNPITEALVNTSNPQADIVVNYVITPTSTTGSCAGPSFTYALKVAVAATPTVVISTPTTVICVGRPVTFTAVGTAGGNLPSYQWYQSSASNPAGVQVGTNSTSYTTNTLASSMDEVWVVMTSNLGCITVNESNIAKSNNVSITVKQIPAPAISDLVKDICSAEGGYTFTGINTNPGSTYQWQYNARDIAGATDQTYFATKGGSYTLAENNGTCTNVSDPATLNIVESPVAYAGSDLYVTEGTFVQLQAGGGTTGTVYAWTPATGLTSTTVNNPSFKADNTITYTVTLTNTGGATNIQCTDHSDVTITVVKPIVVPNVITVNGDGSNDTWNILHIEGYPNATFEIYNRWGNLVWKSTGYPKQWDGTNFRNGEVLPDGTYFYIINLHSQIFTEPYTGWIQIVK